MGSAQQEGGSEGRGLGLGVQQASQTGKALALFPSVPSHPSPTVSPGSPPLLLDPNSGWVLLGVGTPSLPQPPLRGAILEVWPLLLLCLPSLPLPQDPCSWRGPRWAEDQAWDLSRFLGVHVEPWPRSLLILCPPSGSQISPFGHGIPSPPPATPQGCQSCPTSTSPPPSLPPGPTSYPVTGVSSCPFRCLWSPTGAW